MTTRLMHTMRLDFTVQWRNKFYFVGAGLSILIAIILTQLVEPEAMGLLLPVFFLFAVGGSTMLYVAGLLIFEKDERTLDAVIVTPLRRTEYMTSKVVTLALVALFESAIIVFLAYGLTGYNHLLLFGGNLLLGAMLTLMGLILVVRYDSITDFLVPAIALSLVMNMPFLHFLGILESPLWYLVPTSAPVVLMLGAFRPLEAWELLYGVGYSALVIAIGYRWALAAFKKHIVLKERR